MSDLKVCHASMQVTPFQGVADSYPVVNEHSTGLFETDAIAFGLVRRTP